MTEVERRTVVRRYVVDGSYDCRLSVFCRVLFCENCAPVAIVTKLILQLLRIFLLVSEETNNVVVVVCSPMLYFC